MPQLNPPDTQMMAGLRALVPAAAGGVTYAALRPRRRDAPPELLVRLRHVRLAVTRVERRDERALLVHRPLGQRVARLGVLNLAPLRAGHAHAAEAAVDGEHNLAALVVEGLALVLLQHGELHAVDEQQLVQGHVQRERGQRVELDEGLPALEGGAQRGVPGPLGGEVRVGAGAGVWLGGRVA
jgi:hypothetical protein